MTIYRSQEHLETINPVQQLPSCPGRGLQEMMKEHVGSDEQHDHHETNDCGVPDQHKQAKNFANNKWNTEQRYAYRACASHNLAGPGALPRPGHGMQQSSHAHAPAT